MIPPMGGGMSAQVIHGDCLEVMRGMADNSVDAVLTDPPYGTTALHFDQTPIDWPAWWAEIHRVTKENAVIVCFAADLFTVDLIQSNRKNYRYRLVWQKTMPTGFLDANRRPLRAHEDILIFAERMKGSTYNPQKTQGEAYVRKHGGGRMAHVSGHAAIDTISDGGRHPTTVIRFSNHNGALFGQTEKVVKHPTAKPLDLMQWLVSTYTNPGDKVLDPFAGSFSTGIACVQLGREVIGIEKDANYFSIASKRLKTALEQPSLFHVPPSYGRTGTVL